MIPILEPFIHNEFTIKDFFNFAKEITTYDSSLFMASLDVKSLFNNVNITIFPLLQEVTNVTNKFFHIPGLFKGFMMMSASIPIDSRELDNFRAERKSSLSKFYDQKLPLNGTIVPSVVNKVALLNQYMV